MELMIRSILNYQTLKTHLWGNLLGEVSAVYLRVLPVCPDGWSRKMILKAVFQTLEMIRAERFIEGQVTRVETKQEGGFDYGEFDVCGSENDIWTVAFQNENLTCKNNGEIIVTAPDIITIFDNDQGIALTNADVKEGQNVQLGVIQVTDKWWKTGYENVNAIWKQYFEHVNYSGDIIRYEF